MSGDRRTVPSTGGGEVHDFEIKRTGSSACAIGEIGTTTGSVMRENSVGNMSRDADDNLSNQKIERALARLQDHLSHYPRLAVAVSGGVDSMTLASVAHHVLGDKLMLVHAMSPAVPQEATERVREHGQRFGWQVKWVDAGEFSDERYRRNPVNRCYYCKSNLYTRLREVWEGPIASGANLDDLGDYRPGLLAAGEVGVVHPLVEASIDKTLVRAIARLQLLDDIAELPAQPCLSSRVETGLNINVSDLVFVHRMEKYLSETLGLGDLRCRITAAGVRLEVPDDIRKAHAPRWSELYTELQRMVHEDGRVFAGIGDYRRGSAFLHDHEGTKHNAADVKAQACNVGESMSENASHYSDVNSDVVNE